MEPIMKKGKARMQQNIDFKGPKKEQIVPAEINNKVHPETHFSLSASSFLFFPFQFYKQNCRNLKTLPQMQQYLVAFRFKKAYVIFP